MIRPKIFQVIPTKNYTVYVFFEDGKIKLYDAKKLIQTGGIYDVLKDIDFFINRCTIINGTLAWDVDGKRSTDKCIDICPDTIYDYCENVKESDVKIA